MPMYKRRIYSGIFSRRGGRNRMETRIGKWGNSLALRIPQSIHDEVETGPAVGGKAW